MSVTVRDILRPLLDGTRRGEVKWSYAPEDTMIRAKIGRAIVRLMREAPARASDGNPVLYFVYVSDPSFKVSETIEEGDPDFATADELYRLGSDGRGTAGEADELLTGILQTLKR